MNDSKPLDVPSIDSYTFSSPSFQESFIKFKDYYEKGMLTDVILLTNGQSIKCHRLILASYCRYFESMFTHSFKERNESTIPLEGISFGILKSIIDFFYTRSIVISKHNALDLLSSCNFLQIEELISACTKFLIQHLDLQSSINVANVAFTLNELPLYSKATGLIEKLFYKAYKLNEFQSMNIHVLKRLLASDDLNVKNEKEVYEAVVSWIQHDIGRPSFLPELLDLVRLPLLSHLELKEIVSNFIIYSNNVSLALVQEALEYKTYEKNHIQKPELSRQKIRPRKSYSGILFYMGGQGSNGISESLVRIFRWPNMNWEALNDPLSTRGHCGCLWYKGAIIRIGGSFKGECLRDVTVYYPVGYRSMTWNKKKLRKMTVPRKRLGVCCINDIIYAVGGVCDNKNLNIVEAYSIKGRRWQERAHMQHCQGDVAVVELRGSIIAIGGNTGMRSLQNCESYSPLDNEWQDIAPLNIPRHGAGALTIDDFVYVFGGFNNRTPLKSVEKYIPESNKWIMLNDMNYPRGEAGVACIGRNIFIIGGRDGRRHLGGMEIYNVDDDRWEKGPDLKNFKVGADLVTGFIYPDTLERLLGKVITGVLIDEF